MELGTAATFLLFYHYWLQHFGFDLLWLFAGWLIALVLLVILFAYDLRWYLLPDVIMFPLIGLSALVAFIQVSLLSTSADNIVGSLLSLLGSVCILGGLYFGLWLASKGEWIGFGDVKLGIALGLLLMDWKAALLTLFLANFIGTLIVIPGLLTRRLSRQTQIPFGPLLIAGFFITVVGGEVIMTGYMNVSTWLSTTLLML